jgi:rhodanese-related sulfurtransferase
MFFKGIFSSINDMSAEEVRKYLHDNPSGSFTLLDVRTSEENAKSHIHGSKLIPIDELADRLDEIDREHPVIAY